MRLNRRTNAISTRLTMKDRDDGNINNVEISTRCFLRFGFRLPSTVRMIPKLFYCTADKNTNSFQIHCTNSYLVTVRFRLVLVITTFANAGSICCLWYPAQHMKLTIWNSLKEWRSRSVSMCACQLNMFRARGNLGTLTNILRGSHY